MAEYYCILSTINPIFPSKIGRVQVKYLNCLMYSGMCKLLCSGEATRQAKKVDDFFVVVHGELSYEFALLASSVEL
jgi:hypothetical protein